MPTKTRVWRGILGRYLKDCEERQMGEESVKGYKRHLVRIFEDLESAGRNTHPSKVTREDIAFLMGRWKGEVSYRSNRATILNNFLQWNGNPVVKNMNLRWPKSSRPNADWLEPEQAEALKVQLESPLERLVIHLELDLGLRRVELIRLKLGDVGTKFVKVLGKGRMGGKPRKVPTILKLTERILADYMNWRQEQIMEMYQRFPEYREPSSLIIVRHRGVMKGAGRTAITNLVRRISTKAGLKFTGHTLRRTYGRTLWMAGVKLETIKELLGHEDTKTTLLYLGINSEDLEDAMVLVTKYKENLLCPPQGIFSP